MPGPTSVGDSWARVSSLEFLGGMGMEDWQALEEEDMRIALHDHKASITLAQLAALENIIAPINLTLYERPNNSSSSSSSNSWSIAGSSNNNRKRLYECDEASWEIMMTAQKEGPGGSIALKPASSRKKTTSKRKRK